jgi:chemotaxis protein CheD
VATEPTAITTVLGSCVAVCLHDPVATVGGMNHYLLPTHVSREQSLRFGTVAIEALLAEVLARGAGRTRLQAKVFGGASVMGVPDAGQRRLGDENVKLALRQLAGLAIPVVDGDVGGTRGRKLVFHSDDGSAWVRLL